jgi:hypothetical protein
MLESHHKVVGESHDRHATACPLTPLVDPNIENVVQEDVRQERADARPLRRAFDRLTPLAALQNAGPQPLANQP